MILRGRRLGVLGPVCAMLLVAAVGLVNAASAKEPSVRQKAFGSAEKAAQALETAYRRGERKAIAEILGDRGFRLVSSGDPVVDRHEREWFLSLYREGHDLVPDGETRATLELGSDGQPYPIPLVKEYGRWRFDPVEGHEDLLSRRMSKNELSALNVVVALVDAQRAYFKETARKDAPPEYARKIVSSAGHRDGLVWKGKKGEAQGPLAGLAAAAREEGYRAPKDGEPQVYRGYYYRILTAQGQNAPGGARDYLVNGKLTGGFALLAYPVRYGVSGILTFLVNQEGVVYQKDLGPDTMPQGRRMARFDPDGTWSKGM